MILYFAETKLFVEINNSWVEYKRNINKIQPISIWIPWDSLRNILTRLTERNWKPWETFTIKNYVVSIFSPNPEKISFPRKPQSSLSLSRDSSNSETCGAGDFAVPPFLPPVYPAPHEFSNKHSFLSLISDGCLI